MSYPLAFIWGISALHGWGVYGINLLRHWPKAAGAPAYCAADLHLESLGGLDPLSLRALAPALIQSSQIRASGSFDQRDTPYEGIVLHSVGNRFTGSAAPGEPYLTGRKTCAAAFIEDTVMPDAVSTASRFSVIIAGSTWCEEILRANGVTNVKTVIQGVDPSIFHPAPRSGAMDDRFAVFSGGKLEHRKGQDLVVLAFRAFAQRHPEAVLVTAWHSSWPNIAITLNASERTAPVGFREDGKADVAGWAKANGIPEHQFIDVGSIPNHLMARVLREMDVGLFPNRCEGGTNLVAMECMACGIPAIVSNNTGHKDLAATGATYVLERQGHVSFGPIGTDGWGESDVDEIVELLERVWANREEARRRGADGAEAMATWNWRNQIGKLHEALVA